MTDLELHEQRREKWRLTGKPLRTIEEARAFLELVGFSLFYPTRPATLIPTFLGAWCGTDVNLPTPQKAFSDPRVQEATGMMVRLLREHYAYEAPLYDENVTFLLTASTFPFFYALVGERNPKQPPKPGGRSPNIPSWPAIPMQPFSVAGRSPNRSCWRPWVREFLRRHWINR